MKHGKSIEQLASEINRQRENKRDFLPQVSEMHAFNHEGRVNIGFNLDDKELFTAGLTKNGHDNLGELVDIPKKYYSRMLGYPDLLAANLNHWMKATSDRRLVRVLDGDVRAILSKKYRRLDNYDLFNLILPILMKEQVKIESCEVTADRLYIKAWTQEIEGEVKPGDLVNAGILVQNSEVGKGKLGIKPLIYRQVCSNGAVIDELATEQYHIGREAEIDLIEYAEDTNLAQDKAFWLKCRDTVRHSMNRATFDTVIQKMKDSTKRIIEDPMKSIELMDNKYGFQETEKNDLIKHLIGGNDLSSWGLGNAVTRMAQDVPSYDRSTELESIGYLVMNQNWN